MSTAASDISSLVIRATSPADELRGRDEAFAALVARYQDMAFACAYATLGDRALAEDAAQDAFLAAWLNLPRLRQPEAFGGWLRRIVVREALRRGRDRGRLVPLAEAFDVASTALQPDEDVERHDTVQALLASLPEHERTTVLLFYMGDHSQSEIAGLLGLTVTAVKQRLHAARQRLKKREAEIMSEINDNRPSRDEGFRTRLDQRLRALTTADYARVLGLVNTMEPDMEQEHAEWLYNRRFLASSPLHNRSFIAEDEATGKLLGYGAIEQESPSTVHRQYGAVEGPSEAAWYRLHLVAAPGPAEAGSIEALYQRLELEARSLGAEGLWLRETTDAQAVLELLPREGFSEMNRSTEWRMDAASSPPSTNATAPVVTSLSDERRQNLRYLEDLQSFWNEPAVGYGIDPRAPYALEELDRLLHLPHIVPESYFIARRESVEGVLNVWHPHEATPDRASVGMRIRADAADSGVEEALLTSALLYVAAHELSELVTQTLGKPEEAPSYYARLGFEPSMQMVTLSKTL